MKLQDTSSHILKIIPKYIYTWNFVGTRIISLGRHLHPPMIQTQIMKGGYNLRTTILSAISLHPMDSINKNLNKKIQL